MKHESTKAATTVEKPTSTKDESDSEAGDSDNENEPKNDGSGSSDNEEKKVSSVEDDDEEWEKFQKKLNKREKLEGKSKISHSVHCPHFPEDKQEYWWTYICDRKSRTLLTAPYHVTNLVDREEVQLKFTAPRWPGVYTFAVCLRSGNNNHWHRSGGVFVCIRRRRQHILAQFSVSVHSHNRFVCRHGPAARTEIRC